jgi:AAA family ATP:ADP antiporter
MFRRIATALWGNFESKEEVQKLGFLSALFFLVIGIYWALRPMKDGLFFAIVGFEHLWKAKIVSMIVLVPLIALYGKFLDRFDRSKFFYLLAIAYVIGTIGFALAFMHPTIGLANTVKSQSRLLGWAWYVFVESFGSILVAFMWSFTTDTTKPDAAKRMFPVIILFAQLGNILGPLCMNAKFLNLSSSAPVVAMCAGLMAIMGLVFWVFMRVTPADQLQGYEVEGSQKEEKHAEPGLFEGLRLLLTETYLLGMFTLIFMYEVLVTVFDNHFKQSVGAAFPLEVDANAYLSSYGTWVGIVAFASVILGINNINKYLGMRVSLLTLPALIGAAVVALYMFPSALNVAFWIMVLSKAVNYAFNQPTFKQLYIPTTPDTKYKAQAWLEMFGSRGSKATASGINSFRVPIGVETFINIVAFASIGCIGLWVLIAIYVAKTYNSAIKEKRVVC